VFVILSPHNQVVRTFKSLSLIFFKEQSNPLSPSLSYDYFGVLNPNPNDFKNSSRK
jgi:hypothetical protein